MQYIFGSDGYYDTEVGNMTGVILLCSGFLGEGSLGGRLLGGRPLGGGLLGGRPLGGGLLGGRSLGGGLLGGRSLADIFLDHNLHWLFIIT